MHYRSLGVDGPSASALCLGAMTFGTTVDEETATAILDRFTEAGGTFVDTSNNYAFWADGADGFESEELLGRWIARRGNREELVLATKLGARPVPGLPFPEHMEGLSARAVREAAEGSLRRLGTDRLDLYYAHVTDPATPVEETMGAFAALVADGKATALGCSNHSAAELDEANRLAAERGWPGYRCIQQRHSYLRPRPGADFGIQKHADEALLSHLAQRPELTLLAYSPLLGGSYCRPDRPLREGYAWPEAKARLAVLAEVAEETGATVNQVVLAWLLGHPVPTVPVVGASSVAQLEESLGALDLVLDEEQRRRLDDAA
ncbi:aryl-alcohol dehydrogenase-like predicted oxidoreductase [Streptomyces sp. 1114.5]|uniref:aldo/keto reductase n=1 Tax=Streptomyces sp. 1114.5 TaxID=1938830 RepID=UPI000EB3858B|nr:aldo/keto reductase [Streptomyces sp. 1114.5]RKT17111.1 aryl-alcohol dehydrogenase-like predicted oxidoreductase [Streptomyces sp. 1114.5]